MIISGGESFKLSSTARWGRIRYEACVAKLKGLFLLVKHLITSQTTGLGLARGNAHKQINSNDNDDKRAWKQKTAKQTESN